MVKNRSNSGDGDGKVESAEEQEHALMNCRVGLECFESELIALRGEVSSSIGRVLDALQGCIQQVDLAAAPKPDSTPDGESMDVARLARLNEELQRALAGERAEISRRTQTVSSSAGDIPAEGKVAMFPQQ